ncbi:hypothetical protein [Streptomyces sp. NPDC017941]|uniref:hypothetical protein n=1 Tax=Streptomyces sp. NPDC017941 TaxID=3365018 RepID=UPI003791CF0A
MAAADLVLHAARELRGTVREFTGPRGVERHVGECLGLTGVVEWVFRWTLAEPPATPGEERVTRLGAEDHEKLLARGPVHLGPHHRAVTSPRTGRPVRSAERNSAWWPVSGLWMLAPALTGAST